MMAIPHHRPGGAERQPPPVSRCISSRSICSELSKDFGRFQSRMDKLATHISQAHTDVNNVNISARKITGRFEKIERVELQDEATPELPIFKE